MQSMTSVLSMYDSYTFFTAPNYAGFDDDSDRFESRFKRLLQADRTAFLAGEAVDMQATLGELKK